MVLIIESELLSQRRYMTALIVGYGYMVVWILLLNFAMVVSTSLCIDGWQVELGGMVQPPCRQNNHHPIPFPGVNRLQVRLHPLHAPLPHSLRAVAVGRGCLDGAVLAVYLHMRAPQLPGPLVLGE